MSILFVTRYLNFFLFVKRTHNSYLFCITKHSMGNRSIKCNYAYSYTRLWAKVLEYEFMPESMKYSLKYLNPFKNTSFTYGIYENVVGKQKETKIYLIVQTHKAFTPDPSPPGVQWAPETFCNSFSTPLLFSGLAGSLLNLLLASLIAEPFIWHSCPSWTNF